MAQFEINTGISVFSIYTKAVKGYNSYSVNYGNNDNLVQLSVDNRGMLYSIDCIYTEGIREEPLELPRREDMERFFRLEGPPEEDAGIRWPLRVNLHPQKRELDILLYSSNLKPAYCYCDGRVEIYYNDQREYDEELDEFLTVFVPSCIKVLDLSDEEYAYLKQYVK